MRRISAFLIAGILFAGSTLNADIVVVSGSSIQAAPPTVSGVDLLETQFLSSSSSGGDTLSGPRHVEMFDGSVGDETNPNTNGTDYVRADPGDSFTVNLDTSVNTLGYDITDIFSVAGWNTAGSGRADQNYSIALGFVGGGTATLVNGTTEWNDNPDINFWTTVSFTNGSGGPLTSDTVLLDGTDVSGAEATNVVATGVNSITFTITAGSNPDVYHEFDVFGTATAVPEPGSLGFVACLAGLAISKRRRRS